MLFFSLLLMKGIHYQIIINDCKFASFFPCYAWRVRYKQGNKKKERKERVCYLKKPIVMAITHCFPRNPRH